MNPLGKGPWVNVGVLSGREIWYKTAFPTPRIQFWCRSTAARQMLDFRQEGEYGTRYRVAYNWNANSTSDTQARYAAKKIILQRVKNICFGSPNATDEPYDVKWCTPNGDGCFPPDYTDQIGSGAPITQLVDRYTQCQESTGYYRMQTLVNTPALVSQHCPPTAAVPCAIAPSQGVDATASGPDGGSGTCYAFGEVVADPGVVCSEAAEGGECDLVEPTLTGSDDPGDPVTPEP